MHNELNPHLSLFELMQGMDVSLDCPKLLRNHVLFRSGDVCTHLQADEVIQNLARAVVLARIDDHEARRLLKPAPHGETAGGASTSG